MSGGIFGADSDMNLGVWGFRRTFTLTLQPNNKQETKIYQLFCDICSNLLIVWLRNFTWVPVISK